MTHTLKTLALSFSLGAATLGFAGIAIACDGAGCDRTAESTSVYARPRPPEIELGPQAFVSPNTDKPGLPDACCEGDATPTAIAPTAPPAFALGKTN
jgi:hypothetical protein